MNLWPSKNNIIRELFVRTADENYITARWCIVNSLNYDFAWLSVHALEKYMKAVLLSNGCSVKDKKYGHDIVELFKVIKLKYPDLVISNFEKPEIYKIYWDDFNAEEFCQRIYDNGHADNRYAISGYEIRIQYLFMLDQLVFSIRRLICQLDDRWLDSEDPQAPTFTNRELLKKNPSHYGWMDMPLDRAITREGNMAIQAAALNMNIPFAPNFEHQDPRIRFSSSNPVIMRRILEPLKNEDKNIVQDAIVLGDWLLENTYWSKDIRDEINTAITDAENTQNLP